MQQPQPSSPSSPSSSPAFPPSHHALSVADPDRLCDQHLYAGLRIDLNRDLDPSVANVADLLLCTRALICGRRLRLWNHRRRVVFPSIGTRPWIFWVVRDRGICFVCGRPLCKCEKFVVKKP